MQSLNILVVDDSSTMRSMLKRILKMSGVLIAGLFEAPNGAEALRLLEAQAMDVVMADLNMPVMGGLEMIGHLREASGRMKVPVIVVSTESSDTRILEINQQGIDFIHKPFTPEQVRDSIQKLLGGMSHASE